MKWYKRDPDAALVGMVSLTDEQYRAYNVIIDILYSREGDLDDDPHFLCRALNWNKQHWLRVRSELLALGKIHLKSSGKLTANRVESEILSAQKVSEKFKVFREKRLNNNGHADARATNTPTPTPRLPLKSPKLEKQEAYRPSGMSPEVGDDYRSPPPHKPEHQHEMQPLPDQLPINPAKPWKRLTPEELSAQYPKKPA